MSPRKPKEPVRKRTITLTQRGLDAANVTDYPLGASVLVCGQLRVIRRAINARGFYTVAPVYGVERWHWREVRLAPEREKSEPVFIFDESASMTDADFARVAEVLGERNIAQTFGVPRSYIDPLQIATKPQREDSH